VRESPDLCIISFTVQLRRFVCADDPSLDNNVTPLEIEV
jgi:hypothetical protein